MGLFAGLGWVAREGVGLGAWGRLTKVMLTNEIPVSKKENLVGALQCFLVSADCLMQSFGPRWCRRLIRRRRLGTWLLLGGWILLPVGLIASLFC